MDDLDMYGFEDPERWESYDWDLARDIAEESAMIEMACPCGREAAQCEATVDWKTGEGCPRSTDDEEVNNALDSGQGGWN